MLRWVCCLISVACHAAAPHVERFLLDNTALGPHVLGDLVTADAVAATAQTLELWPDGTASMVTTMESASGSGPETFALRGRWRAAGRTVMLDFEGAATRCARDSDALRCPHGMHVLVFRAR